MVENMIRDYEKVARQLEAIIKALNEAALNSEAISIAKACDRAEVNQAWLYRILNNIDDYKISDDLLERLADARDKVISVIIQRIDDIVAGDRKSSDGSILEESGTKVVRDQLILKQEQWKLKNLLPKHFNEGSNQQVIAINDQSNNQYNVLVTNLSQDQLIALASVKLLGDSSNG